MVSDPSTENYSGIAEKILERSQSIALRMSVGNGNWQTIFITKNIAAYGYAREDFLSGKLVWVDIVHPDDREDLLKLLGGFDEFKNDQYSIVYRIVKADGSPVWVSHNSLVVRDVTGKILYADCIISDYTETKAQIESIGEHFHQQAVLNEILQGLHDVDLEKAMQIILEKSGAYLDLGRVVLFEDSPDHKTCRAIQEWHNDGVTPLTGRGDYILGYAEDIPEIARDLDVFGRHISEYCKMPEGVRETFAFEGTVASAIFAITINDERFGFIAFDECIKKRRWPRETIRFLESVANLVAPVIIRRRSEMIIKSLALTDQLTGLNNRHHLETCLNRAIASAREIGQSGYVLFIDMDDFKIINDAYGHDYGDAILKEVSAFLKAHFGNDGSIFRFGGDEFVILLEPARAADIYNVVNGLLTRAQLPWNVLDRTFYCTLSIGVVRFPEAREDNREIIKNADIAMYQAKKMGKNNYVFYTSTLDNDSVARAEMEKAMRESIDRDFHGFEVYYQPLVRPDLGIIGVEALIRWDLQDGRQLGPVKFIPLAEYLGLIIPIGEYVLRESSRLCHAVNARRPEFFVSVNVSIRQFKQQDFMERSLGILDREGVRRDNIVMEITEGMAIHDMQRMKFLVGELRRNGIRIAMDDFGTGYSSLGNLRDLPIDVVKIDRGFINEVTTDAYSKSFIRFITDLVHSMGRKVCVEGVETPGQLKFCRECQVDYMQGFHLWEPMPAAQLLALLEEQEHTLNNEGRHQ